MKVKASNNIVAAFVVILLGMFINPLYAEKNQPYVDEELLHMGYFLGIDFPVYGIQPFNAQNDSLVPMVSWGLSVGWVFDYRLGRYFNARFSPSVSFEQRNIVGRTIDADGNIYGEGIFTKDDSGKELERMNKKVPIMSIPISLPLHIKWSAEREENFRPYVITGAGVSLDLWAKKRVSFMPFHPHMFDVFADVGFGCDFYFPWFKLCPEIRYRIGFMNMNTSKKYWDNINWEPEYGVSTDNNTKKTDPWYHEGFLDMGTLEGKRIFNQKISLIFYFE